MKIAYFRALAFTGVVLGATGCDSASGAGDYAVYRIASNEGSGSPGCGTDDEGDSSNLRTGATVLVFGVAGAEGDTLYLDLGGVTLQGAIQEDGSYAFAGKSVGVDEIGGETILDSDGDGLDDNLEDDFVDADGDNEDDQLDDEVDTDQDGQDDRFQDALVDANNDGEDDRYVETGGATLETILSYAVSFVDEGGSITGTNKTVVKLECSGSADDCAPYTDLLDCTVTSEFVGIKVEDADLVLPEESGPAQP